MLLIYIENNSEFPESEAVIQIDNMNDSALYMTGSQYGEYKTGVVCSRLWIRVTSQAE